MGAQAAQTGVVTGAGRGIGREIARRLAARGMQVLVTDLDGAAAERTAAELGGGAWSMSGDVRDPDHHRLVASAAAERGRLAVWVNNAGVLRTVPVWEHPDGDVRLLVEANVLGVVWGCRAAVEAMRGHGGDIVNMASLSGLGPVPGLAVYAATKHAVLGFSTSLQGDLDLERIPIRVHAVCPDAVATDMVRERERDAGAAVLFSAGSLLQAADVADAAVAMIGTRRLVRVIPRSRGWLVRLNAAVPRAGLTTLRLFRWRGRRNLARRT